MRFENTKPSCNQLQGQQRNRAVEAREILKALDIVSPFRMHKYSHVIVFKSCKLIKRAIRNENHDEHEEVIRTVLSMLQGSESVCMLDQLCAG